ncbi:magnesium/cobalt transporter CorA [Azotosporobacter soli]|uniref:magnesium/cobalt transporter CorA n=1 Tax=Azotosporobacter soli TaxID=3055040 RepID=UPI0031FE9559
MRKKRRSIAPKVGLSPGTLMHIGEIRAEEVKLRVIHYNAENIEEREQLPLEQLPGLVAQPGVTWIDIQGLDAKVVADVGSLFDVHPLILEDILNTNQRPKFEDYGEYLCIIAKSLTASQDEAGYESEQVSMILGEGYVISFRESSARANDVFAGVYERVVHGKGKLHTRRADYLFYALLDNLVDHYFLVLEEIGEKIENVEEEIVAQPNPGLLQDLHRLKREMIYIRKAVWPARELVGALGRGESAHIEEATHIYLRDLYDHVIQVIETVEIYREMLSGMQDIYLSSISNRMNEIMKLLTIISTIFIPLTFIAGVYGMNFENMPELKWQYGYYGVLSAMALAALTMAAYFRRRRWL